MKLLPLLGMSIKDKQVFFSYRNGMALIRDNFQHMTLPQYCICGSEDSVIHIYKCLILNESDDYIQYEHIYNGDISEQIQVFNRMKNAMEKRCELNNLFDISMWSPVWSALIVLGNKH